MKIILSVLAALTLATPAAAGNVFENTYQLFNGLNSFCTTQFIETPEGNMALTANHCVDQDNSPSVNVDAEVDGEVVSTTVYNTSIRTYRLNADIALLKILDPKADFETVPMATPEEFASLELGSDVIAVGYPGTRWSDSTITIDEGKFLGLVPSIDPNDTTVDLVKTTADIYYGSSGGGIYAEFDGELKLIAVISMLDPEQHLLFSYGIPITDVIDMIPGDTGE